MYKYRKLSTASILCIELHCVCLFVVVFILLVSLKNQPPIAIKSILKRLLSLSLRSTLLKVNSNTFKDFRQLNLIYSKELENVLIASREGRNVFGSGERLHILRRHS
jgi:hypothetical protein